MKIQILGSGCANCKKLMANAEEAAQALGLVYEVEKITDVNEIMKFGVFFTPALAVDGKVLFTGKIATPDEIKQALQG